jgi:hypothetical protein
MSRSLAAALLAADVVAIVLVAAWLARWFRAAPTDLARQSAPAPAPGVAAASLHRPALTVLPTVPFVPPPRMERRTVAFPALTERYG